MQAIEFVNLCFIINGSSMKNLLIVLMLLLSITACNKDNPNENEDEFLTSIKAGQTDGVGIKYVDFEPDEKLVTSNGSNWYLKIDLNNDSIDDFELKYTSMSYGRWYNRYSQIIPLGDNSVCASKSITGSDFDYVESLEYGDTIGINNSWINSESYLYKFYRNWQHYYDPDTTIVSEAFFGDWYTQSNIFVGVRIMKDANQFFGWIDMKDATLRRYAVSSAY